MRMTVTMYRAYRAAIDLDADIYHLHDPELLIVALLLKKRGYRVVFDCHEDYAQKIRGKDWIPKFARPALSATYRRFSRMVLPKLDHIVAAADGVAAALETSNVTVIRNLPSVAQITCNRDFRRRQPDMVLYTGGLTGKRGIEQVIRGLIEYCSVPWRLVIVGRENKLVRKRLADYLEDGRIDYRGIVSFEEVVEMMGIASIGVVCNQPYFGYQDALPNKLFEFMAAGLPVVCSAFPVWKELVEGNGAGTTCDSEIPASIAAACARLLSNATERRNMGERGRTLIENEYSWEKEAARLESVYRKCLDGR
jgi:glycosyltransferase involved in cell wall biosynthesis